jgi:hypothetical protein
MQAPQFPAAVMAPARQSKNARAAGNYSWRRSEDVARQSINAVRGARDRPRSLSGARIDGKNIRARVDLSKPLSSTGAISDFPSTAALLATRPH